MRPLVVGTAAALISAGCVLLSSWDDTHASWIGSHVSEYIELNGEPDHIRVLESGNSEYEWHVVPIDPSCYQYFEVDSEGLIIGTRHVGRCGVIG